MSPQIEIVVEDGLDLLDVQEPQGGGGCLIFRGQVATAVWNENPESYVQVLLNSPNKHYREIGAHFQAIARSVVDLENLEDIVSPALKVFSNGIYSVWLEDFDLKSGYFICANYSQDASSLSLFRPREIFIFDTILETAIEKNTVELWQRKIRRKIRRNVKSCIILVEIPHEEGFFVIDGHHRLRAYIKEGISPRAIVIRKLNPQEIVVENIKDFDTMMSETGIRHLRKRPKE